MFQPRVPNPAALALCLAISPLASHAQLLVDFNSNQSAGGTPVAGDPADAANAAHQETGYECYHASHETAGDFLTATYGPTFSLTGAATVDMTPAWPNSTANTVQQSIGRSQGQTDTWLGNNQNLLRDWIGCDGRTSQGGNGAWDGVTGTPTYMTLTFAGLPAAGYDMTTFHHDVENMNSDFTIEVSVDGGNSFGLPITGRMTNSLAGGTPAENEILAGTPPNEAGGDPVDLTSTQALSFTAVAGQDVVLRFSPLPPGATGPVHRMFFGMNGFALVQSMSLADTDGDDLPDAWEDQHFGNNDGTATQAELDLQDGGGDPDMDNVDNETEFFNGTDPNDDDSDDDNLFDDEEVAAMTDPNDADSDGDTLLDGDEVKVHTTDPNDDDSDDDFFFDQNEVDPGGPGTAKDPGAFPISPDGLFVDFTSTEFGGQTGVFQDQMRQPYIADHETDLSVNRSEVYSVPGFAAANVTLAVDFPDTVADTVKQLIGRTNGQTLAYTGSDADLARDWIGADARMAQGGNGFELPTSISFTLTGLPAGAYLYTSFHHDVQNQRGDFDVRLSDANNADVAYDSLTMTASGAGANPSAGETLHTLASTFVAVITSNGVDPVVFTYQAVEGDDGNGGTDVVTSFVGINGFDLIPANDTDGDGLTDEYEDANGLDKTIPDSANDNDNDRLSNLREFQIGTKPDEADTDSDGADDGDEIDAGSDPFVQDTDGDGLLDGPELAIGSDPNNIDTDGDGLLDGEDPDPIDANVPSAAETLCAYWPLDTTDGVTTPDQGPNGYDMMLNNMDATNFVLDDGHQAAMFDNPTNTMLTYTATAGDDIPITLHDVYTVAMWVKIKGTGQSDLRFFSEGSTSTDVPLFNLGTRNDGTDDTADLYVRPVGGPAHEFSNGMPLDDTWRHVAITGNGHTSQYLFYVDGALDRDDFTFRSLTATPLDTTSIGGILRANASHWVTGLVDDVGLWKKILRAEDIAELASGTPPDGLGGPGFAITDIVYDPGAGTVELTWNSKPGKSYAIRFSDDLDDSADNDPRDWPDLEDSYPSDGESTSYTDEGAPAGRRFYIIEEF